MSQKHDNFKSGTAPDDQPASIAADTNVTRSKVNGPWSAAAITRRALDDLREVAEIMHRRQRHPDDVLHALAERAAAWHRRGAKIGEQDVLFAVLAVWPAHQPYADPQYALAQDRTRAAIAAQQTELAGAAYRDGYFDGYSDGLRSIHNEIVDKIREVVADELPEALRALGVQMGGTYA